MKNEKKCGRPVLTTTLLASCCEWTTLQRVDQGDQKCWYSRFLEHSLRLHVYTLKASLCYNQNWRTNTRPTVASWRNFFTIYLYCRSPNRLAREQVTPLSLPAAIMIWNNVLPEVFTLTCVVSYNVDNLKLKCQEGTLRSCKFELRC